MGYLETFRKYLASEELKLTRQRAAILDGIFVTHGHFDADDLFFALRKGGKRISKATVYRTLELLTAAGLIREVDVGKGHRAFEHIFGRSHHDHLICTSCGKMVEFDDPVVEELQNRVCRRFSFQGESHSLRILGRCASCRKR
jgi:Fur family ferric uptake transcriptional regulator